MLSRHCVVRYAPSLQMSRRIIVSHHRLPHRRREFFDVAYDRCLTRCSGRKIISYTAIHCHQEQYTQYCLTVAISLSVASLKTLCGRRLPWTDIHDCHLHEVMDGRT